MPNYEDQKAALLEFLRQAIIAGTLHRDCYDSTEHSLNLCDSMADFHQHLTDVLPDLKTHPAAHAHAHVVCTLASAFVPPDMTLAA